MGFAGGLLACAAAPTPGRRPLTNLAGPTGSGADPPRQNVTAERQDITAGQRRRTTAISRITALGPVV
jgi:hypothetical protein